MMKKTKSLLALVLAMLIAFGGTVCAFAAVPEEAEDNGSFATANTLAPDTSIKGNIADVDDEDFYAVTLKDSGLVTVSLAHDVKTDADAAASYFVVTVYDSEKNVLDTFKSTGADASASIDFSVIPGTYYVKVDWDRVLDETLEYVLSTEIDKSALFETEPNNTASQATALTVSKKGDTKLYYGAITESDVDYYLVSFAKPSLAFFGIYNTAAKAGSYKATLIKVVDGVNGMTTEKVVGSISIDDGEKVKESPLFGVNGGTYYLKVEGVSGSTGGYQVRVYAGTSNSTDEYEYNNEVKHANALNVGKSITGNIFDASDIDIFKFTAPKDNKGYEVTVADYDNKKDVANGQWFVEIIDESGAKVAEKATVTNAEKVVIGTDSLAAGIYYIKVSAGNVVTGETYKVAIAEKKVSADDKTEEDDGKTTVDEFISDIKGIDWSGFWKNFEGWFEYINVMGIVKDLMTSVMHFITTFIFANM